MEILNFFIKKKYASIILMLIILNLGIIFFIFLLDNNKSLPSRTELPPMKGISGIENGLDLLASNPTIRQNNNYGKLTQTVASLKDNSVSLSQRSSYADSLEFYVLALYHDTNDHSLYLYAQKVSKFFKDNYGDQKILTPPCYDPQCADRSQPQEILDVISEIKNADLPTGLKNDHIKDLTNDGYLQKEYPESIVRSYLITAEDIRSSDDYKKINLNEKIYNEIVDYLKKAFPDAYNKVINS